MPIYKPPTVLVKPTMSEAERVVREATRQHRTLIIVGKCRVDYLGRARSKLEPGERILILKADGALLVHRPVGYEPVNWMPGGGTALHVIRQNDNLEIRATRKSPPESVKVFFDKVAIVSALNLVDAGDFSLYASEQDMQKAVLMKPDLLEKGFKPISYEKKVEPGFVDVYGVDEKGKLVVVEIKRKKAGKEAALQLARYVEAIKARSNRELRGILVAPSIAKDVQRLLLTMGLEFKHLDPKKCSETIRNAQTRKLSEFFKQNHI